MKIALLFLYFSVSEKIWKGTLKYWKIKEKEKSAQAE